MNLATIIKGSKLNQKFQRFAEPIIDTINLAYSIVHDYTVIAGLKVLHKGCANIDRLELDCCKYSKYINNKKLVSLLCKNPEGQPDSEHLVVSNRNGKDIYCYCACRKLSKDL